jgi:hypothetical protein
MMMMMRTTMRRPPGDITHTSKQGARPLFCRPLAVRDTSTENSQSLHPAAHHGKEERITSRLLFSLLSIAIHFFPFLILSIISIFSLLFYLLGTITNTTQHNKTQLLHQ